MSSFPEHEDNIKALAAMGFDVSEALEGGKVTLESCRYDDLIYLMSDVIRELQKQGFQVPRLHTT